MITAILIAGSILLATRLQNDQTPDDTSAAGAVCGNDDIEASEACDDGNTLSGDGCSATCQIESGTTAVCGNGTVETGETCEDGNTVSGDGCSATCQTETVAVCGNNATETGETCDDGNTISGDGCSATCQTEIIDGGGNACASSTEVISVTLSSAAGSCDYPTKENNGYASGINEFSVGVASRNVCSFNTVNASSEGSNFRYDDAFAVSINNAILVASHSPLYDPFPNSGSLKVWNGFATIDQLRLRTQNNPHPARCAGTGTCSIPPSDTNKSDFSFSLDPATATALAQYLYESDSYNIKLHAVGDDNSSDCRVDTFVFELEVETKPSSCSCDFVAPVCGNGSLEIGEGCDDGNTLDGDSCSSTCNANGLPNTALFDDNNKYVLVGILLLLGALMVNRFDPSSLLNMYDFEAKKEKSRREARKKGREDFEQRFGDY